MSHQGRPRFNLQEDECRDTRDACMQKEDGVRHGDKVASCKSKERGLKQIQPCQHLELGLAVFRVI